jgi:small-conductance mechanosensitive channel/CRP-like cAMP-binding protein
MEQSVIFWGLVLMLGIPLVTIVLGEGIERLSRQRNPLTSTLIYTRGLFLPLLAALLVGEKLFHLPPRTFLFRSIETLLWCAIAYTLLSLLNAWLTSEAKQFSWQVQVPNLLFQSSRVFVILCIIAYLVTGVWQINLSEVFTALGIGSLVIALALQDTLSNLVSGFLLLFEAPLSIGDWVKIKDQEGEVIEINWRAVRLKTDERDIVVIPNGVLGQEVIYNYTMTDPLHEETVTISFSRENPPNQVKQALRQVAMATPGIVLQPEPEIRTKAYSDFAITYEVSIYIQALQTVEAIERVRDELLTRIYYAAQRGNLSLPYPTQIHYQFAGHTLQQANSYEKILDFLRSLTYFTFFSSETMQFIAQHSALQTYGVGELVIRSGEVANGFYLIQEGSARVSVVNLQGREQELVRLLPMDFFGETVLLPNEPSPISVGVITDVQAIAIPPHVIMNLAQTYPRFASEMNRLIETRREAARVASVNQMTPALPEKETASERLETYAALMQYLIKKAV